MKTILKNHTSLETAYKVDDYPYGFRLRTSIFYWIETVAKKGDRFCTCTINPKNGRYNAVKKSTFTNIGFMFLDENNHVKWTGLNIYSKPEQIEAFINKVGEDNLNEEQNKQYRQLTGKKVVEIDEFSGKVKKDFSVKWEYEVTGQGWKTNEAGQRFWDKGEKGKCDEVKITFDRPDGVSLKEIFKAMKSLNQEKLNQVFEIRKSPTWGDRAGTVRICTRGGNQLGTVSEASYKNYLASDTNLMEEEAA